MLLAASGLGSTMVGYPVAAAGDTGDSDETTTEDDETTEEELKKSLEEMDLHLASQAAGVQSNAVDQPSNSADDAKIYVGQNKNAKTATAKPYAIESFEEFKNREAPVGFSPDNSQGWSSPSTNVVSTSSDNKTYVKRTTTLNFDGIPKFEFGVGLGVKFSFDFKGVSASITVDLYLGAATITVSSFGIGVGVTDKGLCLKDWSTKYYGVKMTGSICVSASLTESSLSIGLSPKVCANPCPTKGFNCPICKGVSLNGISIPVP